MDPEIVAQVGVTLVLGAIKNPTLKMKVKRSIAKIVSVAMKSYAGDQEFKDLIQDSLISYQGN